MKMSDEEFKEEIFKRSDEYISKRKKKRRKMLKIAVSTAASVILCFTLVLTVAPIFVKNSVNGSEMYNPTGEIRLSNGNNNENTITESRNDECVCEETESSPYKVQLIKEGSDTSYTVKSDEAIEFANYLLVFSEKSSIEDDEDGPENSEVITVKVFNGEQIVVDCCIMGNQLSFDGKTWVTLDDREEKKLYEMLYKIDD